MSTARRPTSRTRRAQTAQKKTATRNRGASRTVRATPRAKANNNLPMILGLSGGGLVLLIIIIAVAAGGGGGKNKGNENGGKSNRPEPVDVSGMEREGERLCEEGMRIVQAAEPEFRKTTLPRSQQRDLKKRLLKARELLRSGLSFYDKASRKSGVDKKYNLRRYMKAQKYIGGRILELPD